MTPRERVRLALNHQEPDRVPLDFGGLLASINVYTYDALVQALGLQAEPNDAILSREWSNVPKPAEAILERWGIDFRRVWLGGPENYTPVVNRAERSFVDEWGLTWKRVGGYNEFINPPLQRGRYPLKGAGRR